jgi:ketosteroid isomerase-like protein
MLNDSAALTQVLNDYYRTFSTLNLEAIYSYFHTPALIVGPVGVFAIAKPEDLATIFGPTMQDLRARGYGRSEYEARRIEQLSATAAIASGVAVRYKSDGQEMERAGLTYLLHKSDGRWKLAMMTLHDVAASF